MKQLIHNVQQWLLFEGRCSGCGKALAEGVKEIYGESMYIVCECQRLYVYDHEAKVFQRYNSECNLNKRREELDSDVEVAA